jgi:hypothetical protein
MKRTAGLSVLLLALCACGERASPPRWAGPDAAPGASPDAAPPTDLLPVPPADGAAPDVPDSAALSAPLPLADLALWLDGNVGFQRGPTRWTDRSPQHHVFVGQGPPEALPTAATIAAHGAVHFNGYGRLVYDPVDPVEQAPLAIGSQDFLLALVVNAARGQRPNETVFGLMPSLAGDLILPNTGTLFTLALNARLTLDLGVREHSHHVEVPGPFDDARPHLIVVMGKGRAVTIRVDGATVANDPRGRADAGAVLALPFAPVYLGNWDFDQAGLTGEIAEVVLVIGPGATPALAPLEPYLRGKYGL